MAITTTANVKAVLGISGKDDQIAALIPLVEDWMKQYTHDDFEDEEGNDKYPTGYELVAIKMIAHNLSNPSGVASETLGKYSVSFESDYPTHITKGLRRKVRWS